MAVWGVVRDNAYVKNATRLGALVKMRRESRGLTMKELGDLVGVSRTAIDAIENGRTKLPGPDVLRGLARELELTRVELLVAAEYLDEEEAKGPLDAAEIRRATDALEQALAGLHRAADRTESAERALGVREAQFRLLPQSPADSP